LSLLLLLFLNQIQYISELLLGRASLDGLVKRSVKLALEFVMFNGRLIATSTTEFFQPFWD
jgi:hypothetical protein